MNLDELEELLKEERNKLDERSEKLEEAAWFLERLQNEDYNSPEEKTSVEEDLKTILSELNLCA